MTDADVKEAIKLLSSVTIQNESKIEKLTNIVEDVKALIVGQGGGGNGSPESTNPEVVGPELQATARQIQQKYQSVPLEPNLKLHDSRQGIAGQENTKILNLLSKCGRFTETCLKVLKKQESESVDTEGTAELFTLFAAQIAFLQDEFGCLFVATLGDSQTAKLYRALRRNTSSLPPDAIEDLRAAAQVSAALPQQQVQQFQRGRGFRSSRGGFRGDRGGRRPRGSRGFFRNSYQSGHPDLFDQMVDQPNSS